MPASEFGALLSLQERLKERIQGNGDQIAGGICKDFSEYRYQCGVLEGLRTALAEAKELEEIIDKA